MTAPPSSVADRPSGRNYTAQGAARGCGGPSGPPRPPWRREVRDLPQICVNARQMRPVPRQSAGLRCPPSVFRGVPQMARKRNRPPAPTSREARHEFAVAYLNALLKDAGPEELAAALGRIARACGGPKLAEKVELS